jgi:hypothetical protein
MGGSNVRKGLALQRLDKAVRAQLKERQQKEKRSRDKQKPGENGRTMYGAGAYGRGKARKMGPSQVDQTNHMIMY